MVTSLKEILDLSSGTLIRGLKISFDGAINFSIDGWQFEQRRLVRNLLTFSDRDRFCYVYYRNVDVQEHVQNNLLHINNNQNMTFGVFKANGKVFFKDTEPWFVQEDICSGECLGMSLGENFIALQPSHRDTYRSDSYKVYVFHKVLHGQSIKWVVLHSKLVDKKMFIHDNQSLLNIALELL